MRIALVLLFLLVASRTEAQPAFLVFFDWNRATLTAQGQQTIHQAADTALRMRASIEVDGFTDTSGSPQYNQSLSQYRAQTVAAELQRNGVPPGAIHLRSFGESYLRQVTPDDVRDPQNRRVAIILRSPPMMLPPPRIVVPVPIYPPIVYPWGWYPRFGWHGGFRRWRGW